MLIDEIYRDFYIKKINGSYAMYTKYGESHGYRESLDECEEYIDNCYDWEHIAQRLENA